MSRKRSAQQGRILQFHFYLVFGSRFRALRFLQNFSILFCEIYWIMLEASLTCRWCKTVWQCWLPVLWATMGWCGTPHSLSCMNCCIWWNMNCLKSRIESAHPLIILIEYWDNFTLHVDGHEQFQHLVSVIRAWLPIALRYVYTLMMGVSTFPVTPTHYQWLTKNFL